MSRLRHTVMSIPEPFSAAIEPSGTVIAIRGPMTIAGAWDITGSNVPDNPNQKWMLGGVDQFPLDPDGTPKMVLNTTDPGFDRVGNTAVANPAVARPFVIRGMKPRRRIYPNGNQLDVTDHGDGTKTIRVALSDPAFADTTVNNLVLAAGWKAGESARTLPVVNNSILSAAITCWSRPLTVSYQIMAGTVGAPLTALPVEYQAVSHFPYHEVGAPNQALVAKSCRAYDGTNVGAVSWLTLTPDSKGILRWAGNVDVTGLTAGLVTIHTTDYPRIGAARTTGAVHYATSNAAVANVSGDPTTTWNDPLVIAFDPTGARWTAGKKYVFFDTTSTNLLPADATNVVFHSTIDAARAAAANTKPANYTVWMAAIRNQAGSFSDANGLVMASALRRADGWEALIHEGQVVTTTADSVSQTNFTGNIETWTVIRGDPTASNKDNCIFRSAAAIQSCPFRKMKFQDLALEVGQATIFSNSTFNMQWYQNVKGSPKSGRAGDGYGVRGTGDYYVTDSVMLGHDALPNGGAVERNNVRSTGCMSRVIMNATLDRNDTYPGPYGSFQTAADGIVWNAKTLNWNYLIWKDSKGTGIAGDPKLLFRQASVNVLHVSRGNRHIQVGEGSHASFQDNIIDSTDFISDGANTHNTPPFALYYSSGTIYMEMEAHGLVVGDSVTLSGNAPSGYNGTFTVSTVVNGSLVRMTAANPGVTPCTDMGTALLPSGSRPVQHINNRHTGNTYLGFYVDRNGTKQDYYDAGTNLDGSFELLYGTRWKGRVHANRGGGSPLDNQFAFHGLNGVTETDVGGIGGGYPDNTEWPAFYYDGGQNAGFAADWPAGDYRPCRMLRAIGTTVRARVRSHGWSVGTSITVAGVTPSGYNGTYPVASVIDAHTITYIVPTAPGLMTGHGTISGGSITNRPLRVSPLLGKGMVSNSNLTLDGVERGPGGFPAGPYAEVLI